MASKKVQDHVILTRGMLESERGNTMLVNDDGAMVAWISLGDGLMLEISDTPGNSPRLYVSVDEYKPKKIRKYVRENLTGWFVVRWNLDPYPPVDDMERVK